MDGDTYERWVAGYDVETGKPKGRLRTDEQRRAVRRGRRQRPQELVAGGRRAPARSPRRTTPPRTGPPPRSSRWLAQHATTRIGPRGRQVQIPVEQLEAARIRHYTSRAGDPHRHLHLQINARVWAAGKWRGIHTVGVRDSLGAINGIGHAAVMCDPELPRCAGGPRLPSRRDRRGRRARRVRRRLQRPHRADRRATSTDTKPAGGPSTPARNRDHGCAAPGTPAPGPRRVPTRSSHATGPS